MNNNDIAKLDLNQDGMADADLNRDGMVTDEEIELYRKHIVHYFDTQMNSDILSLSAEDKSRFFQMVTDYADIFDKIFHKGIPIVEYCLYGDQWYSAKQNPHEGINWDYDCPMVAEYKVWAKNKKSNQ
jgi:hypothetical protein